MELLAVAEAAGHRAQGQHPPHRGAGGGDGVEQARDLHLAGEAAPLGVHLGHLAVGEDAGGVDHRGHRPVGLGERGQGRGEGVATGDVGGEGDQAPVAAGDGLGEPALRGPSAEHHHPGAGPLEAPGEGGTQAPGAPGDQDHLVVARGEGRGVVGRARGIGRAQGGLEAHHLAAGRREAHVGGDVGAAPLGEQRLDADLGGGPGGEADRLGHGHVRFVGERPGGAGEGLGPGVAVGEGHHQLVGGVAEVAERRHQGLEIVGGRLLPGEDRAHGRAGAGGGAEDHQVRGPVPGGAAPLGLEAGGDRGHQLGVGAQDLVARPALHRPGVPG